MQNVPNSKVQVATPKMKLQQGSSLSGGRTLSQQTFWVVTEMTIIQDSVATRTRTELLSRREKMVPDTNLNKQLNITIATKRKHSRD